MPRDALLAEEAPWSVFRWVAWGKRPADRRRRVELAVFLRRNLDTPWGGWHRTSQLQGALEVWQKALTTAVSQGRIQPHPEDLPRGDFVSAIEAASSTRRCARRSPRSPNVAPTTPTVPVLTPEQLAVLDALSGLVLAKAG